MSGDVTTATAEPTGATGGHRPLRILIAADTFPPDVNGAATFAEQLAVGLAERGHEVHVVAPASSRNYGTFDEEHQGVTLVVHRLKSYKWPLHAWLRFVWPWSVKKWTGPILDAVKPDVLHIQSHVVIGRGIVPEANARGIRVIATNHFMPENLLEYTPFGKWTLPIALKIAWSDAAKTYRLADTITTPTNLAADYLRKAIAGQRVLAISCGIDASRYVAREGRPVNNDIVFVGRVAPEKNLDVLVRAVALLPGSLAATLTIVGDGEMIPKLTALAKELGLEDRVRFLGFVSDEVKRTALTNGTVFAMPSTAELQSISSLEAMASGLPVVAADSMALPHLIDGNGYLFAPGDEHDLAAKLEAVLTASEAEYTAMRERSSAMIEAHDINRTLTTFEALYRGEPVA
ncbi:glycosyltransferase involved in cell wall biosynthesis [Curtobacterium sp. PhB142]|uniref:glycosyltransferase n=1 Tax=Bacteria TaxID=2 RepID=UPI0010495D9F|nr:MULTISPECIES: glycosyltransferase [unclassified Curtobacterium]MBF4586004.1 glycosyltransferase [Curtobacterium sp. VKM Ac-2887]TCL85099.1 glycosyltransferase involved in cell wall biosynthesis [Curtobacterium sp. PhB142]TCM01970.1 glycosyltransferase involved in cell wall biosynthesis [Curtobacterium sp. PhB134]TDW45762.1 glycosyltransferase involved in cell wall biosynthesis [Curtobacterium sp. PhB42]TDW57904.1 glycosyltransferase involved in cell wall biosynthesis [Curtobacterium sp. PhB